MKHNKILVTEGIIIFFFITVFSILLIYIPSIKDRAKVKNIINSINLFENNIYNFYIVYNYFPGDMPNAYKYWDREAFNKHCKYLKYEESSNSQKEIQIFKGFNGDGNNIISINLIDAINTDSFSETTAVGCHLKLAGMISYTPVVLQDFFYADGLWYNPVEKNESIGLMFSTVPSKILNNTNKFNQNINQIQTISTNNKFNNPNITSYQAMLIDKKIDDGFPATGSIRCNSFSDNQQQCCNDSINGICSKNSTYLKKSIPHSASIVYDSKIIENFQTKLATKN